MRSLHLPPGEVPVDNGPKLAVLEPDIVEAVAEVLDLDVAAEGDPAAAEPAAVRRRVGDGGAQEAVETPTHRLHLVLGDGGRQVAQEDTGRFVQGCNENRDKT